LPTCPLNYINNYLFDLRWQSDLSVCLSVWTRITENYHNNNIPGLHLPYRPIILCPIIMLKCLLPWVYKFTLVHLCCCHAMSLLTDKTVNLEISMFYGYID
jgi:hypothetical protein